MSAPLLRFDVYRSAFPFSALGAWLCQLEAPTLLEAQTEAAKKYRPLAVVVMQTTKANEKLEKAVAALKPRRPFVRNSAQKGDALREQSKRLSQQASHINRVR